MENNKRKPLLYTILVAEGAITRDQANEAFDVYNHRRERGQRASFGQVVLSLGMIRAPRLNEFIEMQRKLSGAPGQVPLGVLMIENGVLKPRQVVDALVRREQSGKRLGEFLIAEGLVRRIQVDMLLQQQRRQAA